MLLLGVPLGARESIGTVAAEFGRNQAVEVIEQHVIARVGLVLGVAVDELSAAKKRAAITL